MLNYRIYFFVFIYFFAVVFSASANGKFVISTKNEQATFHISEQEEEVVHTAAYLFTADVARITGRMLHLISENKCNSQIKIGTLGVNDQFDKECERNGIDIDNLKSKWEAYVIKVITNYKGEKGILFVVGSNPRGTAFGLMELSQRIGVSPWCWWADIEPEKQETIILPGDFFLEDAPKVKFRGIFINDEDWGLQPWAAKTFEPETGDIGSKTYEKVFELLLRLKANAIWPAMHDCTRAFFTYPDNIKMADKYGIWVGSSHCEPMLRNNVDEWHRWTPLNGKRGKWNFDENPDQLKEYWKQRINTTANYDGIYTVGMRGIHDGSMPGGKNIDDKVKILGRVLDTQRNLLTNITGKEISSIPQIFCPYKEVLKLYKTGADIPEDVTIMWADDNNGYIRQLSNSDERKRSGGAGVYYHISYWGRPHDYLWLESTPVSLIWEEMHKAYQTNAKNVWIVNVGDIKSNEIGMNFFLNMAWNPDQYSPENLDSYYSHFAEIQFGKQYAEEIGEILRKYFQLGFSRKPEHMGWNGVYPNTPSHDPELSLFHHGDEVQQRIDAYDKLEKQAESLYKKMPGHLKDAFFQLVNYKVIGASNMNKKILYAYKSRVYAQQGRTSSNLYAAKAKKAFDQIKEATANYNNAIANGKWKHMMSFNPRQLPVFDMPETGSYNPSQQTAGGIMPEAYSSIVETESGKLSLPAFNSLTKRSYFVDVFNSGTQPLKWEIEGKDGWIKISKTSGQTETEERIWVSVNWDQVPLSDSVKSIVKFKINGLIYPVQVMAQKLNLEPALKNIFVEDNGLVAIEAENYTKVQNTSECNWKTIQGLGRASDAIGTFPVTAEPFDATNPIKAPELTYDFFTTSLGEASLHFYCLPNQPINDDYQLRFAVSIDNAKPIVVNVALKEEMDENNDEWKNNVLRSVTIQEINVLIQEKGKHKLKIKMIDPGVVIDKIEIVIGEKKNSYFGTSETIVVK